MHRVCPVAVYLLHKPLRPLTRRLPHRPGNCDQCLDRGSSGVHRAEAQNAFLLAGLAHLEPQGDGPSVPISTLESQDWQSFLIGCTSSMLLGVFPFPRR